MAVIDFESYKTQPFYLHHNFENFYKVYLQNRSQILSIGEYYLLESIKWQENNEKEIYEALGLDPTDSNSWKQIGSEIFGVFDIDENEKRIPIIENKLELFLKEFTKFINEEMNKGTIKFSKKYTIEEAKKEYENGVKDKNELIKTVNAFIDAYNNPIDKFLNWRNENNLTKGQINEDEISFLKELFEKSRKNRKKELKIPGDKENRLKNITEESLDEALNLLYSSSGIISNFIGDIGEQATLSFIVNGRQYITETVGTSVLSGKSSEEKERRKDIIDKNVAFYKQEEQKIKNELKESGINLSLKTKDGLFKFGCVYTPKDTGTLKKNLKADEIFTFKFNLESGQEIKKYGISSKTSWSEDADDIKLYSGSFYSALENLFKSNITGAGDIGQVINFLIYIIFNSLGSAFYGSYQIDTKELKRRQDSNKIKELINKGMINTETSGDFYRGSAYPIYMKIIQDFAFQWFTGGISEQTHADFFSIYDGGKHYFIPMSIILKAILKIGYDEENFLLKQNLLTRYTNINNPLSLKDYKDTWDYQEMEKLGLRIFDNSKKTITLSKQQLKGLI